MAKKKIKKTSDMVKKYYKPKTEMGKDLKKTMVAISEEKEANKRNKYPKSVTEKKIKKVNPMDIDKTQKMAAPEKIESKVMCVGMSSFDLEKRIIALEQRIDRIVAAIGKAKSVKGL